MIMGSFDRTTTETTHDHEAHLRQAARTAVKAAS
jgi:hypothetical protein